MASSPTAVDSLDTRPALPPAADVDALRKRAAEALAALTEQQRAYAVAYTRHGNSAQAARDAGYSEKSAADLARRLRAHAGVQEAVRALAALRGAEATYSADDLRALLAAALDFDPETLFIRNAEGQPIGLRSLDSLSAAERLRVKKLDVRMRVSAKGERASFRNLEVELVDPLGIVDRLARLGAYYADSAAVSINLGQLAPPPPPMDPILAELADAVLTDEELRHFVTAGEDDRRALLRSAIARLRAIPTTCEQVATRE